METRNYIRGAFLLLVLTGVGLVAQSYVTYGQTTQATAAQQSTLPLGEQTPVAPPGDGVTVIASQGQEHRHKSSALMAFAENGTVLYYNDSRDIYYDVDPIENTTHSVLVVTQEKKRYAAWSENLVERVNLSTGETEVVYRRVAQGKWHDVDRINDTHLAVADIATDRVFVVDTETGIVEWTWVAQSYAELTGPPYPHDWLHINDVEVLPDGTLQASLRNRDEVVFINRSGVNRSRTLGEPGNHSVIYRQHNPDYIPEERGGPSVLVADSHNNRVVEFAREDGRWKQVWEWEDRRLQWPRDADRLPNDHTLVTNSNGNEVFEVDENGSVVWEVDVFLPYEAERLGTGDESDTGRAATATNISGKSLQSEHTSDGAVGGGASKVVSVLWGFVSALIPNSVINGIVFILPPWLGKADLPALVLTVGGVGTWAVFEVYVSGIRASVQMPLRIKKK